MAPIIEKNPEYQQPYAWLALAYEQKGEWPKAIATMEKCVELDGFGWTVWRSWDICTR